MYSKIQKQQAKSKKTNLFYLLGFTFLVFTLVGCATLKEDAKGILGISTKTLEEGRKEAIVRTFKCDYDTCYRKTREALIENESYIYAQGAKKHLIAAYLSEQDTTPVGIFFKELDAANTQLEVSSPSTYAKEFISAKVFSALEKSLNPGTKIRTDR